MNLIILIVTSVAYRSVVAGIILLVPVNLSNAMLDGGLDFSSGVVLGWALIAVFVVSALGILSQAGGRETQAPEGSAAARPVIVLDAQHPEAA